MIFENARYSSVLHKSAYKLLFFALLVTTCLSAFFAKQWYDASRPDSLYIMSADDVRAGSRTGDSMVGSTHKIAALTRVFLEKVPPRHLARVIDEEQVMKTEQGGGLFTDTDQEYFDIGIIQHGVKVVLNKILCTKDSTCMQVFVENASSVDLCLAQWTFEYLIVLSKGVLKRKSKRKMVAPIVAPTSITVPAKRVKYVVFSVPTCTGTEGMEVCLEESDGGRRFVFLIPNKVLLRAKKRSI